MDKDVKINVRTRDFWPLRNDTALVSVEIGRCSITIRPTSMTSVLFATMVIVKSTVVTITGVRVCETLPDNRGKHPPEDQSPPMQTSDENP